MSPNAVSTSTERFFHKADPISVRSISLARILKAFKVGFTWICLGESGSADFEHLALREEPEQSSHSYIRTALSYPVSDIRSDSLEKASVRPSGQVYSSDLSSRAQLATLISSSRQLLLRHSRKNSLCFT